MRFVKMHGCGNDYVFLDAIAEPSLAVLDDPVALARAMCDRHTGVGADGVIILANPEDRGRSHAQMRIINADGSDGGMCGNGLRCAAKLLVERHGAPANGGLRVAIGERIVNIHATLSPRGAVSEAGVEMGEVGFGTDAARAIGRLLAKTDQGLLSVGGLEVGLVWLGNPHAVAFIDERIEGFDLATVGPTVEHDPAFPERINLHVVNLEDLSKARMRSWERGSGETMACGSGACAAVAEGVRRGWLSGRVRVLMPGGELEVEMMENGHALLIGPATEVFEGEWPE